MKEKRTYKFRLTITFLNGKQWLIGFDHENIAEVMARPLMAHAVPLDISNICLSLEETGQVEWLRRPKELNS